MTEEDFAYIEDEKRTWEEVDRLERGIYEDGKKDGEKIGIEKGAKIGHQKGLEDGEKIGIEKGQTELVLNMIKSGMDIDSIAKVTGLSHSKLEEIMKTGKRLESLPLS